MLKYYLVQAPVTAILGITSLGYVIATGLMFPQVPAIFFLPWLFLPILLLALLPFRRRFRALRTQYDIDGYHTAKTQRVRMPGRLRRKRWLQTVVLHIPSALAAFVAIFFPVATHAMRLGSDLRRDWSVSLPLTIAVFPDYGGYEFGFFSTTGLGRYGMNFFVVQPPEFSEISIQLRIASKPSGSSPGRSVCDERPWYGRLRIVCETPSDRNGNALSIVFHGRAEDKQKVYEILEGIRPAHLD